jgi:hypothetical protein
VHAIKAYVELEVQLSSFLTLMLDRGAWSSSCAGRFLYRKEPSLPILQEVQWGVLLVWTLEKTVLFVLRIKMIHQSSSL